MPRDQENSSWWQRLRAKLYLQVSDDLLDTYRLGNDRLYDGLDELEHERFMRQGTTRTVWDKPVQEQWESLCLWCALTTHTIANKILEQDTLSDPRTAGYLPPETANEALRLYQSAAEWLDRIPVPMGEIALLPAAPLVLDDVAVRLPVYRAALLDALEVLDASLSQFILDLQLKTDLTPLQSKVLKQLRRRHNTLTSEFKEVQLQAQTAHGQQDALRIVDPKIVDLYERLFTLGQLAVMPAVLLQKEELGKEAKEKTGENKPKLWVSKPWIISDPHIRHLLKKDPVAIEALHAFWQGLADPRQGISLYKEVEKLLASGAVHFAEDISGQLIGHDYRPPYSAVYKAMDIVKIADIDVQDGVPFVLSATGKEGNRYLTLEFDYFESHPLMVGKDLE